MNNYLHALNTVMNNGFDRGDRTGTGVRSLFGLDMSFNVKEFLPIITTKFVPFNKIKDELEWFLSGSTRLVDLRERSHNIWSPWVKEDGTIGPGYGKQFRDLDGRDPFVEMLIQLRDNPESRRHVMSLWNFVDIPDMALPPCHGTVIQFYVEPDSNNGTLHMYMHQRSADMFIGVPFNITSYSLLLYLVADFLSMEAGTFKYSIGDAHIYSNHFEMVEEQLKRQPFASYGQSQVGDVKIFKDFVNPLYYLPALDSPIEEIELYRLAWDSIELEDYKHWPSIKAPVAV